MATEGERLDKAAAKFKQLETEIGEIRESQTRIFKVLDEILDGQKRLRDLFRHNEMEFTQTKNYFKELDHEAVDNMHWHIEKLNGILKKNKLPTTREFAIIETDGLTDQKIKG